MLALTLTWEHFNTHPSKLTSKFGRSSKRSSKLQVCESVGLEAFKFGSAWVM